VSSQSSLVVFWQCIYNSLTASISLHAKSSLHTLTFKSELNSLSPLPFILKCLLKRLPPLFQTESESELLYDRQYTANQLDLATRPLRLTTSNFIYQLNTWDHSPYIIFSLMRGWVYRLQLLLVISSLINLRSESRGTNDHILLSQIRDSPNFVDKIPLFIFPRNKGPGYTPRHYFLVTVRLQDLLLKTKSPRISDSQPSPVSLKSQFANHWQMYC
jgi:hypothetical protein